MKKIFNRVLAFVIDMLICTGLTLVLANIPLLNPNSAKVIVLYNGQSVEQVRYEAFKEKLEVYLEDAEIVEDEMKEIKGEYDTYSKLFEGVKVREEITNKKKDEIRAGVDGAYIAKINDYQYKIAKANAYTTVISFVIYILYFSILPIVLKGQTIGKKLFRLKVVDAKDTSKKVPVWKYLVRGILVTELLLIGLDLILVLTLKLNPYLISSYWISNVRYIYEMAFLIVMIIRDDQRSVHDLLLNTRVMLMDKNNNEVFDCLFSEEGLKDEVKEVKDEDKKEVKKTTKKKAKKEVVVAEKVNDKKRINKTN